MAQPTGQGEGHDTDTGLGGNTKLMMADKIRRCLPDCNGTYVESTVQGIDLLFTIDNGSSKTIISREVFYKIPADSRPVLNKTGSLKGPGGKPLSALGEALFTIHLGSLVLEKNVVVADIEDDGLLGIDILLLDKQGPADIIASREVLLLRGVEIPIILVGVKGRVRRVFTIEDAEIPGMSEAVIDVMVESVRADKFQPKNEFIIEPSATFAEKYPLVMAASLIDLKNSPMAKVRLVNPYHETITVKNKVNIGQAEVFEEVATICDKESENGKSCRVRRVQTQHSEETVASPFVPSNKITDIPDVPSHLQEIYEKAIVGRDSEKQKKVALMLHKYQNAFSRDECDLGLTHLGEHCIDTGNARPIKQAPRRVPIAFAEEEKKAIEQMLEQGVIRKSTSPWASPIVLVRKKSGKVRPCVDYRKLNEVTKNDGFPLPRTQDCLDAMAGSVLFSTFDLTSGYHQIPVKQEDVPKTAFCTKYGLYEFTSLPFGLHTAAATCQRIMELAMQGLQWVTCLIYMDDCIVFSKTFDDHVDRVSEVLARIQGANLKLKPEKCHLLQEEVEFLGHVVNGKGVKPNPMNVSKLVNFPKPTNVHEVRQVLGMGSYYRRFVPGYADVVRPLVELTKKSKTFKWSEECDKALAALKVALVGPEIMAYPLTEGKFVLDCDASDYSIGAVLSQIQGEKEKVVPYASRSLNKAEKNYCITDKELLAIRYFVEYFRQYLLGRHFLVRTDHQALVWLFSLKEPKSRIARWIEVLSAYDFSIEHRNGIKHGNADFMSRCPQPGDCECGNEDLWENLKCGPCNKCKKRAEDMQSSLLENHKVRSVKCEVEPDTKLPDRQFPSPSVLLMMMVLFACTVGVLKFGSSASEVIVSLCPYLFYGGYRAVEVLFQQTSHAVKWCYSSLNGVVSQVVWPIRAVSTRPSTQKQTEENIMGDAYKPWAGLCTLKQMKKKQEDDPDLSVVLSWVKKNERPKSAEVNLLSPCVRHYWTLWDTLVLQGGLLYRRFTKRDGTGTFLQLLVPQQMKKDVLNQMHNSVTSGHLGTKRTKQKILQSHYWFDLKEDVKLWVAKCDICAANKSPTKNPRAPFGAIPVGAPLDRLYTDILGPLPETPRSNRYVLVVTDHFTKWVEIFPVPDQTATTCANVILNEVIARYGCPYDLHSDQGRNYESEIFSELCRMLEIRKTRSSPRHPQCNGQVERFNRTLVSMIKTYIKDEQSDWDLNLGCLASAYRSSVHDVTGFTPNFLMFGREIRMPAELVYSSVSGTGKDVDNYGSYVDSLRNRMQKAHEVARKHLQTAAKRQKLSYDVKTNLVSYKPGDAVWLLSEGRKCGVCPKLQPSYEGPYVVTQKLNSLDYAIQKEYKGKCTVVHHNKLKPYKGEHAPLWAKKFITKVPKSNNG